MIFPIPRRSALLVLLSMLTVHAGSVSADLVLETETAEFRARSDQLVSIAMQYEHERNGSHRTDDCQSLCRYVNAFVSVGYDTDQLLVVRPGFNIEF